jgi:AAA+ superfamily predicted ATPase
LADAKDSLLASLRAAVTGAPEDVPLRLHLAELLLSVGLRDEAVSQLAAALSLAPTDATARALMARAIAPQELEPTAGGQPEPGRADAVVPAPSADPADTFDWSRAEDDLGPLDLPELLPPLSGGDDRAEPADDLWKVDEADIRLVDVGGMAEVKARLEAAFLAPMRNTELAALYRKSLRGGLMLYGPPGCGKTFIARAVAGELGAGFLAVSLADVLDMYLGQSERNLRDLFEQARRSAPCVLFLDEIDALGQKRSQVRNSGTRGTVNQLLAELDGVRSSNDGVFVLAATNHPWDVDSALRRPGRLDRTLLVLPPDREAREAILRYHLRDRPVADVDVDVRKLAEGTDGFSGADLAHLCETAAEIAMLAAARSGQVRRIGKADFRDALREVRPSTGPWFESARNVALFANEGGQYDDLLAYLRKRRMV